MVVKSALSLLVVLSLFFTGCAAQNASGKPAEEISGKDKAAAAEVTGNKDPKAEA